MKKNNNKILPCVIGLGYVGLPVFLWLQKKLITVGYYKNKSRIQTIKKKKILIKNINLEI